MPDLAAARVTARAQLVDACSITRDPQGFDDDAIDPVTLEFTPPSGDATNVYAGSCLVGPATDAQRDQEGQVLAVSQRQVRLPFDAPLPLVGDTLTITSVGPEGDASLVGQVFRVSSAESRSIYVTRVVIVERTVVAPS